MVNMQFRDEGEKLITVYLVDSESNPKKYRVLMGEGLGLCTCPDATYRGPGCKHMDRVYDDWWKNHRETARTFGKPVPYVKPQGGLSVHVPAGVTLAVTGPATVTA